MIAKILFWTVATASWVTVKVRLGRYPHYVLYLNSTSAYMFFIIGMIKTLEPPNMGFQSEIIVIILGCFEDN